MSNHGSGSLTESPRLTCHNDFLVRGRIISSFGIPENPNEWAIYLRRSHHSASGTTIEKGTSAAEELTASRALRTESEPQTFKTELQ
jgi:hypothetical protein